MWEKQLVESQLEMPMPGSLIVQLLAQASQGAWLVITKSPDATRTQNIVLLNPVPLTLSYP